MIKDKLNERTLTPQEVRTILNDLKNKGKTIILSSHNPQDLEFLCDKIIRLDAGRIIE